MGQIHLDLTEKEIQDVSPIDVEREAHKDYEKNLYEAIDRGKKSYDGDFFIVILTKKERLLDRVIRNFFFVRASCPTPEYDQTVYHFHRKSDKIEFLWVLPSKDTCYTFLHNINKIAHEERDLLKFILKDKSGELLALSKKLNGETSNSIKINKDH